MVSFFFVLNDAEQPDRFREFRSYARSLVAHSLMPEQQTRTESLLGRGSLSSCTNTKSSQRLAVSLPLLH